MDHTHAYIYIYIYSYLVEPTVVEGDSKAPFSIATTPKCRGGCALLLSLDYTNDP